MGRSLNLLCVHGVGHQEIDPDFKESWAKAILSAVHSCDPSVEAAIDFLEYDELFDHAPLNAITYGIAFAKLLSSLVIHGIGDVLTGTRGLGEVPQAIRWSAGMVAQWSTEDVLRDRTRKRVLAAMQAKSYDAVFAHSLGSLICYDTFARNPKEIQNKIFVSLGSQIGNPGVRDVFAGRIKALDARMWYHLFNPNDHVLTAPVKLMAANFQQIEAPFDIPNDVLNHNATWYLGHANTIATVWRGLAGGVPSQSLQTVARGFKSATSKPNRRALLVGINEYPDPANRLEGCVNDCFLMSSVLQESGFEPEEIRVVLDDRATAQGIMDRLHWLLDGVRDGDQRMLFYSGHGAQIPGYGDKGEPDHVDECLVPYDFDWSPQHAILDDQFFEFYSQLPYESQFVAILDCCHSGGMSRDGGPRIRGLEPPDDIRHRALRWKPDEQMWVPRDFPPMNRSLARKRDGALYLGSDGATRRLGRAAALRTLPDAKYDATRRSLDHKGPYLPVMLEACEEGQLSFEYRHGAASYGAYTFCLALALRISRASGINPTFAGLNSRVTEKLRRLKYLQTPVTVGAKQRVSQRIPWTAVPASKTKKNAVRARRK